MKWSQSRRRRRLIMPLVILAVAAGLMVWGSRERGNCLDEVHDLVVWFLDDVAAGHDPSPRLGDTDPLILRRVIWALEAHASDLARRDAWEVVVRSGDIGEFGDGSATHHAVIRTGGVDRFGLRLVGPGGGQELLIVGYWVPQEDR